MTGLEVLGIVLLAIVCYRLARWLAALFYHFMAPSLGMGVDLRTMGKWAVVTGATDGLGKAFVEELANMGINVVLISRTKSKLTAVAAEIEEEYKVETKIIEADFTKGNEIYEHIEKELAGLEVGVLVNNVGVSYAYPEYFLDLADRQNFYHDILRCNVYSVLSMCQIVMPAMVKQRKGVIINISSTASMIPSPLLSVYGATKVFVSKFSKDLSTEYKKHGLTIQCLVPGYVATKMSKIRKATWMAPSPETYVRNALKTVGIHRSTTGYYPHSILLSSIKLMERVSPRLAECMVIRTMENIRSRSVRKSTQSAQPQSAQ